MTLLDRLRGPVSALAPLLVATLVVDSALPSARAQEPDAPARAPSHTGYIVAVGTERGVDRVIGQVAAAARRSMRRQHDVEYNDADQIFFGASEDAVGQLADARRLLELGRRHYENVELDESIQTLTQSVEAFAASTAVLEDPSEYGDALLYLGASQVLNGALPDARRTFARLHVLQPGRHPDPDIFPPDIVAKFERAAPRDARSPSSSIRVTSEPAGGEVFVDGVARGAAPQTVAGLLGGDHDVRVALPGHAVYTERVSLRTGASEQVTAHLATGGAEGLGAALADLAQGASEARVRALGHLLSVDVLCVLLVSGEPENLSIEALGFDGRTGRRLVRRAASASGSLADVEGSVEELSTQIVTASLTALGAPPDHTGHVRVVTHRRRRPTPPREEPAVYERWWFWTAVGVVAVGAVVGIAAASGGSDRNPGRDQGGQVVLEF